MSKSGRRSSILKTPKPRNPLSDLMVLEAETIDVNQKTRRVSFANLSVVKKFVTDPERNTIWIDQYEETLSQTVSSQNSTLTKEEIFEADIFNCTKVNEFEDSIISNMDLTIPASTENIENICPVIESDDVMEMTRVNLQSRSDMEFTERIPFRSVNFIKNDEEVDMNLTTNVSSMIINDSRKPVENIDLRYADMEFTERIPSEVIETVTKDFPSSRSFQKRPSYYEEQIDMEFTERIPSSSVNFIEKVLPESHQEAEMEFTERLPNYQLEMARKSQNDGKCFNMERNTSESINLRRNERCEHDIEFTERMLCHSMNLYKNIDLRYIDMEFTKRIPSEVIQSATKDFPNRSPWKRSSNCEEQIDMEFTERIPSSSVNFIEKVLPESRQEPEMEFTERLPNYQLEISRKSQNDGKRFNTERNISESSNLCRNERCESDVEFTERMPHQSMNLSKNNDLRYVDMEFTERIPSEVIQSATKDIPNRSPWKRSSNYREQIDMEFTERIPSSSVDLIEKVLPESRQEAEMEFTERVPNYQLEIARKSQNDGKRFNTERNISESSNLCRNERCESDVEFTERMPRQSMNLSKNNDLRYVDMEFTERIPSEVIQSATKDFPNRSPWKRPSNYREQIDMEFTERIPSSSVDLIEKVLPERRQEAEIEFTERLPNYQLEIARKSQNDGKRFNTERNTSESSNLCRNERCESDVEFMERMPHQLMNLSKNNDLRYVDMEFTERIPSEVIQSATKDFPNRSPWKRPSNYGEQIDMEFTERIPSSSVELIEKVLPESRQEVEMEFMERVPNYQLEIARKSQNDGQRFNTERNTSESTNLCRNERYDIDVEFTERMLYHSMNLSKNIDLRYVDMEFTERIPSKVIESVTKNIPNSRSPWKGPSNCGEQIDMEFTERIPSSSVDLIEKVLPERRREMMLNGEEADMEFTERIPAVSVDLSRNTFTEVCLHEIAEKNPSKSDYLSGKEDLTEERQNPDMEFTYKISSNNFDTSRKLHAEDDMEFTEKIPFKYFKISKNVPLNNEDQTATERIPSTSVNLDAQTLNEKLAVKTEFSETIPYKTSETFKVSVPNDGNACSASTIDVTVTNFIHTGNSSRKEPSEYTITNSFQRTPGNESEIESTERLFRDIAKIPFISRSDYETPLKRTRESTMSTPSSTIYNLIESPLIINEPIDNETTYADISSTTISDNDSLGLLSINEMNQSFDLSLNCVEKIRPILFDIDVKGVHQRLQKVLQKVFENLDRLKDKRKAATKATAVTAARAAAAKVFEEHEEIGTDWSAAKLKSDWDEFIQRNDKVRASSYYEKILEMRANCPSWHIIKLKESFVVFTTLNGMFLFEAGFDSETGVVRHVELSKVKRYRNVQPYVQYVCRMFLQKITPESLISSCGKNYTILSLLDFVTLNVQEWEMSIREFEELSVDYGAVFDEGGKVTLSFSSLPLRWWFEIEFNIKDLDDISPGKLKLKLGSVFKSTRSELKAIRSFASNKPKGYKFIRAYVESVKTYILISEEKYRR